MRGIFVFSATAAMLGVASIASAVFFDDFDVDTSANWAVNKSGNVTNNIATFAYDYSALGIGSAPGSSGGSTKGLRLQANVAGAVFSGLSVSPLGQSFTTDFVMTADVWLNYIGPLNGGSSTGGTTQFAGMGWGTAGATAQWAASAQDSVHFSTSLDGGSTTDYRAYSSAAPTSYASGNAVYGTTSTQNTNVYYSTAFPSGTAAPAAQTTLFPSQTGVTNTGVTAFRWRQWRVEKAGTSLTWKIDGTLLATIDLTTVTTSSTKNILINMFDSNSGSGTDPNRLNNMIVDNIQVVPEPATMTALALGMGALLRRRRK